MRIRSLAFACLAAAALSAPAMAQIFIPVGPPVITPRPDIITPQPDLVTPQAPTITTTPEKFGTSSWSSQWDDASTASGCMTEVMFPKTPGAMVPCPGVDANGTALSIATTGSGTYTPPVTTVTANPDLVTPQPDLVTPQAPTCSQPGISIPGGFGSRPC